MRVTLIFILINVRRRTRVINVKQYEGFGDGPCNNESRSSEKDVIHKLALHSNKIHTTPKVGLGASKDLTYIRPSMRRVFSGTTKTCSMSMTRFTSREDCLLTVSGRSAAVSKLVIDHFIASGLRISKPTLRRRLQNTGLYER
ncbi:hypothetical protein TNCV_559081 [Trichonephila clavipes]|nr:hypothetical protein TNCV_559081 [Trichonephila clavipes]